MQSAVFVFPGQGSQHPGMGRELYEASEAARRVWDAANQAVDIDLARVAFEGPDEELNQTPVAQPAMTAADLAVFAALEERDVRPRAVAGHSLGEYAAVCAAGAMTTQQAVRLTRRRGTLMQACADARPGRMVAIIGLDGRAVETACRQAAQETGGVVSAANFNSPAQVVITGEAQPVDRAAALATEQGAKRTVPLKVSGPWHSTLMTSAQEAFAKELAQETLADARVPVYTNLDARPKQSAQAVREALVGQMTLPVHWGSTVQALHRDFAEAVFLECGPGRVLRGLIRAIDREVTCLGVDSPRALQEAVDRLA